MSKQLEAELTRLDTALADAERQGLAIVSAVRLLRRQTATGVIAGLPRRLEQLPAHAEPLSAALSEASRRFDYDAETAFADGSYLDETTPPADDER